MNTLHKLRFGTINCLTLKDDIKLAHVIETSQKLDHNITFVQETHIIGFDKFDYKDGWTFINSGLKRKAASGVGMILSPGTKLLDMTPIIEGRILHTLIIVKGIKISAFCIYSPTNTAGESSKDTFYAQLRKGIKTASTTHPNFKTIIAGDWNASIGKDVSTSRYVGRFNDDLETNNNGRRLASFCEEHKLSLMNTKFQTKDIHRYTWVSPTGYRKRIDYFACNAFIEQCVTNCRVYRGASTEYESDHRLLVLDLKCRTKWERKHFFQSREPAPKPLISTLINDENMRKRYSEELDKICNVDSNPEGLDDIEEAIVTAASEATNNVCPLMQRTLELPPWSDDEYQQLIMKRRECKSISGKKQLTAQIKKKRQQLKSAYFHCRAEAINQAAEERKVEEEFRLAKSRMTSPSKKLLISNDKLTEHFKQHFSQRSCDKQPEVINPENYPFLLPSIEEAVDESPPSNEEIQDAIKVMKNNKCKGTDNLSNEQIKYNCSSRFFNLIVILVSTIWAVVSYPKSWFHSRVCCLFKNKGSAIEGKNYRGLSINATLNRIFTTVILNRIRNVYEDNISENQFGFRKNRSTTDAIFTIRKIVEKTDDFYVMCFIDLRAAYDHINRDMLFDVFGIRTGCKLFTRLLRELYNNTTATVSGAKEIFSTFVGCRQGAQESPTLFNIYMDFVTKICEYEVKKKFPNTGIHYKYHIASECNSRAMRMHSPSHGEDYMHSLLYADDLMIVSRDVMEMQEILNIYNETFKRFGLTIAADKTKTLPFNATEEITTATSLISMNNEEIENVTQFRYLGHMISNESANNFLKHQIAAAYSKWAEMKDILTDRDIHLHIRIRFLEACVRSRLLYSVQAWRLNVSELKKVEAVWMNFLRRMVKRGFARRNAPKDKDDVIAKEDLDWSYVYSNEDILRITKSHPISDFCEQQHLKYIAHITRQKNDFFPKRWLFASPAKKYVRNEWTVFEKSTGLDQIALRNLMSKKEDFMKWMSKQAPPHPSGRKNRPTGQLR